MNDYLLWALFVVNGGIPGGGGALTQPQAVAYFQTKAGCERVLSVVQDLMPTKRPMQCIQADFRTPRGAY